MIAKLLLIKAYWLEKIKTYYRCKIKIDTYHVRYSTYGTYILHILQLQFSPFQHLMWLLKMGSVLAYLIIFGKVDQSLFPREDIVSIPRNDVVSIPYAFVCTFGSCM